MGTDQASQISCFLAVPAQYPRQLLSGPCALPRQGRHPGVSRQTRLGQPAAKKHGTASAGLVRQYGMRLEKARKYLPAVVCLQAGRCSKPSFRPTRKRRAVPPMSRRYRDAGIVVLRRGVPTTGLKGGSPMAVIF